MSTVAFFSRRTCNFQGTMCARTLRALKSLIQHRSFRVQLFSVRFTLFSIRWHFFNVKGNSKNRTKPETPPPKQNRKISTNRLSVCRQNVTPNVRLHMHEWMVYRPVTRGGAGGAFAPPPQAPKVRILILIIQVKECCRLNWSLKLNNDV